MVSWVYGFMGRRVAVAPFLAWEGSSCLSTSRLLRKPAIHTVRRIAGRGPQAGLQLTSTSCLKSGHCMLVQSALRSTARRKSTFMARSGHAFQRWKAFLASLGMPTERLLAMHCDGGWTIKVGRSDWLGQSGIGIGFGNCFNSSTTPFRDCNSSGRMRSLNSMGGSVVVNVDAILG